MIMSKDDGRTTDQDQADGGGAESRPQQAGEAGTTRFGMEDGDNTDVPATGGPAADEDSGDNA
jgi:hypothetical protein